MAQTHAARVSTPPDQVTPWCIMGGLGVVVLVAYWNTITGPTESLVNSWMSPQYSHGFLVPLFAAVLIAMRREPFQSVAPVERWWGVGIIAAGLALRLFATYFHFVMLDMLSIIPVLVGVFVVAGGLSVLRWAGPPLAFLIFMIPLPTVGERSLFVPLQSVATRISTFTLQTLGVPDAFNQGNRILIGNGIELNVEEACSGLRMATIFLAMAVALTMITNRSWWEKAIVILSAIPIALLVNMTRIVVTAILYLVLGQDSELAKHFFHDLAGWFMMPLALLFLYVEMQVLSHIFVEEEQAAPATAGFGSVPPTRSPVSSRAR
jgi:exosortase